MSPYSYSYFISARNNGRKVHTDIEDALDFYYAEDYHQKYQEKSQNRGGW